MTAWEFMISCCHSHHPSSTGNGHDHDHEGEGHHHGGHNHGGHDHGGGHSRVALLIQTGTCLAGGVAGTSIEAASGSTAGLASVGAVAALACYLIAYVAGAWSIATDAIKDLLKGRVSIDFLMVCAAAGSAVLGHWADGVALLFLFSLSHSLESIILGRTRRAIADLMKLTPDEALRLRDGREEIIPLSEVFVEDVLIVRPGERIPADGVLLSGMTSVDESAVNGESIPADKQPGDTLFAGTLNQQGAIQLKVTRVAAESTLARMVALVEQAQSQRAQSQQFTEWFGERYSWVVLGLSGLMLLVARFGLQDAWPDAFYRMLTVLVVASPCAVVISIPAAILVAISSAARGGVLFKGGRIIERTALLKGIAFDKTGTLTQGRPRVVELLPATGVSEQELLSAAAALERHSEHPLARAIVTAAEERDCLHALAENVQAVTASGMTGTLQGKVHRLGKLTWLAGEYRENGPAPIPGLEAAQQRGETVVGVMRENRWLGAVAIADTLRPTAQACLQELRRLGINDQIMLTGDAEPVAREMAGQLGLQYRAALLPADKLQAIEEMRRRLGPVGMIGDGMNDAPSLAAADVGISLGGAGSDVALETADVVILADDLRRLPYAIGLSRRAQQIIRQNLIMAFGTMGLLLVATVFVTLPLPVAVLGHEGSTVLVILNGLRLFGYRRPA